MTINIRFLLTGFFLLALFFPLLSADDQGSVDRQVFEEFKQDVEEHLERIDRKVDMGNETLAIAKEYSESADRLTDRFLAVIGLVLAVSTAFLAVVVVELNRRAKARFEKLQSQRYDEYTKELDRRHAEYTKLLDQQSEEYKEQITRLISTEAGTMYIKDNAQILFIQKQGERGKDTSFAKLKAAVFSEYEEKNLAAIEVDGFSAIIQNGSFSNFLQRDNELKIIVMNDDLFKELPVLEEEGEGKRKEFTEESRTLIEALFEKLDQNKAGFVLFGRTQLGGFKIPYKAYANEPYSVYTNINNLLKYMMAAKQIKA